MLHYACDFNEEQMSDRISSRNKNYTLVNLLNDRASQHPDQTAYTFLEDGEREVSSLPYQQLDQRARAIAAYLQAQLTIGDRVLLVYSQGLEAIAADVGALIRSNTVRQSDRHRKRLGN